MQTIHEAAAAMRAGRTTPIDLVEECLAKIEHWEPHVRAWVFVDREGARDEARRLTDELRGGNDRGPLHGIPLGIKDIFDVLRWPTAAGSRLWANRIAYQDAPVVADLRAAGAIFLGKTVTTQFASFDPSVTRNPWNSTRTPGGSSSGSAAAVATGMCLGALGSQTGGSITRPASYCGVAGFKPSYGLLSLDGVVPLAHSLDHVGFIARCVHDLALIFDAIGKQHSAEQSGERIAFDLGQRSVALDRENISLGRLRGLFDERSELVVRQAMDETCATLRDQHARLDETALPSAFDEVVARHRTVMAVEAAQYHRERLRWHPDDYQACIRRLLNEGLACSAVEYADCKRHQVELRAKLRNLLSGGKVFLTPATTSPAPALDTTGDPAFNSPWSYVGLPTVSIPTGQFVEGLPLALQLSADAGREDLLLGAARWCEQALGVGPLSPPLPGR